MIHPDTLYDLARIDAAARRAPAGRHRRAGAVPAPRRSLRERSGRLLVRWGVRLAPSAAALATPPRRIRRVLAGPVAS